MHISKMLDPYFKENAKSALALFGSTSPSYLILQSLDAANRYMCDFKEKLSVFLPKIKKVKTSLLNSGYTLIGNEPLKITLFAKPYGYLGTEIADYLAENSLIAEFSDSDYITLMLTPENGEEALNKLLKTLSTLQKKEEIKTSFPKLIPAKQKTSIRAAAFSRCEKINSSDALGRISALPTVGCPPAVPIVMCGEEIDLQIINCLEYYKIKKILVVK